MDDNLLGLRAVRMPGFAPGEWLNTEQPLDAAGLRGQVVLVDFWDYTCINCIRTLPYLTNWHARYADLGLVVIGVHAPEFTFARARAQIETAIEQYGIRYPVLLDNDFQTWDRFANRAWPTKHLIDHEGYVRYRVQGEGRYGQTEQAIQAALRLRSPDVPLPAILPPLRPEDAPGAACYQTTPELYAGYQRGSLGNAEGYAAGSPVIYRMPLPPERSQPYFYAAGIWQAGPESFAFAGQDGGQIILPYSAAGVSAVLSPSADPVEVALNLRRSRALPIVEVRLDGQPLTPEQAGDDIEFDDGGVSIVVVTRPRLYDLVRHGGFETRELSLTFRAGGLALYSFTFTTCIAGDTVT